MPVAQLPALKNRYNCDLHGADFRGALNYVLNPTDNQLEKARFSLPEAMNLLKGCGSVLE